MIPKVHSEAVKAVTAEDSSALVLVHDLMFGPKSPLCIAVFIVGARLAPLAAAFSDCRGLGCPPVIDAICSLPRTPTTSPHVLLRRKAVLFVAETVRIFCFWNACDPNAMVLLGLLVSAVVLDK